MRFLHVADLHIGKRVHERPMLDEQEHAFDQLISIAEDQRVDAVLVAGDVFDRPNPSSVALELSERFLASFVRRNIPVFVIPGNHDSAQQVAYCSTITDAAGLHVARPYRGHIATFSLEDADGPVCVHLLPFVRLLDVRAAFPQREAEIKTHHDSVRVALEEHPLEQGVRHVLVAHQFVTAMGIDPERCESETMSSLGGLDNVDASLFDAFDYVALGHLHGPQRVGRNAVRYAGSPVRYSFSEISQKKAACIVDLDGQGNVSVTQIPLVPLHAMREITCSLEDLEAGKDTGDHQDYMHVTLTDRSAYDAFNRVKAVYPHLLLLSWQEAEIAASSGKMTLSEMKQKSCFELFSDFFTEQTGQSLTDEQRAIVQDIMRDDQTGRTGQAGAWSVLDEKPGEQASGKGERS